MYFTCVLADPMYVSHVHAVNILVNGLYLDSMYRFRNTGSSGYVESSLLLKQWQSLVHGESVG